ncbi:MAG: Nif3-like dinuclear metal center hexameric protein [Acidimicrobiia bacterium]|nr:Nif3-like dinuclear metal center hexameric protein [Acidimicrobiia bacterium]
MPSVGDITARLSRAFNIDKAAGWDPVGLQLGDPAAPADRVAVCHEVTPQVVDTVVAADIDLLVSYHPLLFRPTTSLVAGSGPSGRAYRLIASGTALLVAHTAFDVLPGGTADRLAAALDLEDVSGFGPAWGADVSKVVTFSPAADVDAVATAMAAAGAGRIGRYTHCSFRADGIGTFLPGEGADPTAGLPGVLNSEPEVRVEMLAPRSLVGAVVAALVAAHPYEEPAYDVIDVQANAGFIGRRGTLRAETTVEQLAAVVADRIGGVARIAGTGTVRTVALIPGSGGAMLRETDADVVVTGDVSHHQARDALAGGTRIIDPGHAATERPGVRALYAAVAKSVGTALDFTNVDPDPWKEA